MVYFLYGGNSIMNKYLTQMIVYMLDSRIKSAVKYTFEDERVKLSKMYRKTYPLDLRLTIGKPNYSERKFIKQCIKAGEPFPIKKIQLKYWLKKKARR
jgi:hypothetical protein